MRRWLDRLDNGTRPCRAGASEAPLLGAQAPAAPLGSGSSTFRGPVAAATSRVAAAATATTESAAAAESAATGPLGGLVHAELASAELLAVELLDRRLCLRRGGELDEGHAAGAPGGTVKQDEDVDHLACFRKQGLDLLAGRIETQISDKYFGIDDILPRPFGPPWVFMTSPARPARQGRCWSVSLPAALVKRLSAPCGVAHRIHRDPARPGRRGGARGG
jgi:hypothetical protein